MGTVAVAVVEEGRTGLSTFVTAGRASATRRPTASPRSCSEAGGRRSRPGPGNCD